MWWSTATSVGHEYELVSTIHAKVVGDDGTVSDMGALTDGDGNTLTATTTFTPGRRMAPSMWSSRWTLGICNWKANDA